VETAGAAGLPGLIGAVHSRPYSPAHSSRFRDDAAGSNAFRNEQSDARQRLGGTGAGGA
jgi:hypothetical protein